jgi:hypothetical protein
MGPKMRSDDKLTLGLTVIGAVITFAVGSGLSVLFNSFAAGYGVLTIIALGYLAVRWLPGEFRRAHTQSRVKEAEREMRRSGPSLPAADPLSARRSYSPRSCCGDRLGPHPLLQRSLLPERRTTAGSS